MPEKPSDDHEDRAAPVTEDQPRHDPGDIRALAEAFEALNRTSQTMEEAYRRLERRVRELNRELEDKNRELALTTDYLSNLLESMSDGVIAVDTSGKIVRFNRAAASTLGYDADELTGRPFREVFQRDFDAPRKPDAQLLRARSGRSIPVSERDSRVADEAGNALGRVKTFQDLSEIHALREQIRQVDRLAAIGEMAATVAHEIRNPLGGIRGFASFLQQDTPESDPRRRLVDKILVGTQSLEKVVTELLEYTRPIELQLEAISCNEPVRAALPFLTYDEARIVVVNDVDAGLRIRGDVDKLRQVFLNILLNAVQSISGSGEVRIESNADDRHVTLVVVDTGCGIEAEEVEKVFSPFYTTKEKGTGLGLAVTRKIVEAHGGTLSAESTPGVGTRMQVVLPRAE